MSTHRISNDLVELGVNAEGGHLWPVRFNSVRGWLEPMHRAAWADEGGLEDAPTVMRRLSGNFFAAPFGASDLDPSERRPHGATANGQWQLVQKSGTEIELQLEGKVLGASVIKRIHYQEHEFQGGAGSLPVGHHAMLRLQQPGFLSCSPRVWSGTPPDPLETDTERGRSLLAYPQFQHLSGVQLASGPSEPWLSRRVLPKLRAATWARIRSPLSTQKGALAAFRPNRRLSL